MTTIDTPTATAPALAPHTPGKRRKFTDNTKRDIIHEYDAAAPGSTKVVLDKYDISTATIFSWRKQLGMPPSTRIAHTTRGSEPPARGTTRPDPEPVVASGPGALAVIATPTIFAETDTPGITLEFSGDELDVLDACAFLEDTDRYQLVARVITEWIATQSGDSDVRLCLAARRGRRAAAV